MLAVWTFWHNNITATDNDRENNDIRERLIFSWCRYTIPISLWRRFCYNKCDNHQHNNITKNQPQHCKHWWIQSANTIFKMAASVKCDQQFYFRLPETYWCHYVVISYCLDVISWCHYVVMSLCRDFISLCCYFVMSLCRDVIMLWCRFVVMSLCCDVVMSLYVVVSLRCDAVATVSLCPGVVISWCRDVIMLLCRYLFMSLVIRYVVP